LILPTDQKSISGNDQCANLALGQHRETACVASLKADAPSPFHQDAAAETSELSTAASLGSEGSHRKFALLSTRSPVSRLTSSDTSYL
jgi:hypothetical protein